MGRGRLSLIFFFFSSRRRHTRSKRDWSSDVCSSDLAFPQGRALPDREVCDRAPVVSTRRARPRPHQAERSEERRVGKSVEHGGRRVMKKKKKTKTQQPITKTVRSITRIIKLHCGRG